MFYSPFYFDPTYVLILIGVALSLAASARLNATYATYSGIRSRCGMTGAQAAEQLLRSQGIYDVTVRHVSGRLTDHYDPRTKTVNLSDAVYGATSIAAIGVAAHECGHAMQDAQEYAPLRLRAALVPAANFGAQISWPLILIGFFIGGGILVNVGILLFSLSVLFQLVTLPVEYRRIPPGGQASRFHRDPAGTGGRTGKKGAGSCRVNLCGRCRCLHSSAAASAYFIWKQRQGKLTKGILWQSRQTEVWKTGK